MRLTSTFLSALGVASDKAVPQSGDNLLVVPNVLQPVVALRGPVNIISVPVGTATSPYRNSFAVNFSRLNVNQAASTNNLAFLSKGFWYVFLSLSISADASLTPTAT